MIQVLSEEVRCRLRSGIAITSVGQCIEELLLNSVDAQATCIAIRVDLEVFRVQVVDNGCGISSEDLELLGQRYCTSKCHSLNDLEDLRFYGFRGEAIASMADVSSIVEICSKRRDGGTTFNKLLQHGKPLPVQRAEENRPSVGTTVTLYNLFYNLPVRRKRVDPNLEMEKIRQRIEAASLLRPSISFSLKNEAQHSMNLQLPKTRNVSFRFCQIHGLAKSQLLRELRHSHASFRIDGLISCEGHYNKSLQFLYVNGRLVLKTRLHKLIDFIIKKESVICRSKPNQAGVPSTSPGRPKACSDLHGIFIVDIQCPYYEYDVCYEPAKTLIEFQDWAPVILCVEEGLRTLLKKEGLYLQPSKEDITEFNQRHNFSLSHLAESAALLAAPETCDPTSLSSKLVFRSKTIPARLEKGSAVVSKTVRDSQGGLTKIERGSEQVVSETERGSEQVVSETERGSELVVSETERGNEQVVSETERGSEQVVSETERGSEQVVSETERGSEQVVSETERGSEQVVSETERGSEQVVSETERGSELVVSETERCSELVVSETERGSEQVVSETERGSEQVVSETERGNKQVVSETERGSEQVVLETERGSEQVVSETERGSELVVSETERLSEQVVSDTVGDSGQVVAERVSEAIKGEAERGSKVVVTKRHCDRGKTEITTQGVVPATERISKGVVTERYSFEVGAKIERYNECFVVETQRESQGVTGGILLPSFIAESVSRERLQEWNTTADEESKDESTSVSSEEQNKLGLYPGGCSNSVQNPARNSHMLWQSSYRPLVCGRHSFSNGRSDTSEDKFCSLTAARKNPGTGDLGTDRSRSLETNNLVNVVSCNSASKIAGQSRRSKPFKLPPSAKLGTLDRFRRQYGKQSSCSNLGHRQGAEPERTQDVSCHSLGCLQMKPTDGETCVASSEVTSQLTLSHYDCLKVKNPGIMKHCSSLTARLKNIMAKASNTTETQSGDPKVQKDSQPPQSTALPTGSVEQKGALDTRLSTEIEEQNISLKGSQSPPHEWLLHYEQTLGRNVFINTCSGLSTYSPPPPEQAVPCTKDLTTMAVSVVCGNGYQYQCHPFRSEVLEPFLPAHSAETRLPKDTGDGSLQTLCSEWRNPVFPRHPAVALDISKNHSDTLAVKIHNILYPYRFTKDMIHSMQVLQQVDKKFIACLIDTRDEERAEPGGNLLVLVDQHAAHERVRLEQLISDSYKQLPEGSGKKLKVSTVDPPLELDVTEEQCRLLRIRAEALKRSGLTLAFPDGGRPRVLVSEIPLCFMERAASESQRKRATSVRKMVEELVLDEVQVSHSTRVTGGTLPGTVLKVLASQACHGAVKFNDPLSLEECRHLIGRLASCSLPFQCAHGRPSILPLADLLHLPPDDQISAKPNLNRLRRHYKAWRLFGDQQQPISKETLPDTSQPEAERHL
ncbi:DNA mismatch repair protein Mlh3 [Gastrophryne carolinensis]